MAIRRPAKAAARAADPSQPPQIEGFTGFVRIGGGATSTVWRGTQESMRRPIAVKLMHAPLSGGKARERFEEEGRLAGRLGQHPAIATVHDYGVDRAGRPYLVMQHYPLGSLTRFLDQPNEASVAKVLAWGVLIADALEFAHGESVVHRDVKPDNILQDVFSDGVVLTDFGIAVDHQPGAVADPTALTVQYASPEMLRQKGVWPASDVWSLAATLYTLLERRPPYCGWDEHPDLIELSDQIMNSPLPAFSRTDVPAEVFHVLQRALRGAIHERPASAGGFAGELCQTQRLLGLEVSRRELPPASGGQVAPPRPRTDLAVNGTKDAAAQRTLPEQLAGSGVVRPPTPEVPSNTITGYALPKPAQPAAGPNPKPEPSPFNVPTYIPPNQPQPPAPSVAVPQQPGTQAGGGAAKVDPYASDTVMSADPPPPPPVEPGSADGRRGRRQLVRSVIGVVAIAVCAVGAYLIAEDLTSAHSAPASSTIAKSTTTPGVAASTFAPKPPTGVTVALVGGGTSAQVSWTDPPASSQYSAIISMGAGHNPIPARGADPLTVTGLTPGQPYCFAVGYLLDLHGDVTYSTPVCVNGGVAS